MSSILWLGTALTGLAGIGGTVWYFRRRRTTSLSHPPHVQFQGAIRSIREGHHPGFEKFLADIPGLPRLEVREEYDSTQPTLRSRTNPDGAREPPPRAEAGGDPRGRAPAARQDTDLPPAQVFREYDIRGLAETELSARAVYWIGSAIGTQIRRQGRTTVMIGRDDRASGVELSKSLAKGLVLSGVNIINIGKATTPMLYLAQQKKQIPDGIMLTASHNGPEYNGLKIVLEGKPLYGEHIQAIKERIHNSDIDRAEQIGALRSINFFDEYVQSVLDACRPAENGFHVVVDCANGMAGPYLPFILRKLGHRVTELYCDVDGSFPNHPPDPTKEENLEALAEAVRTHKADVGLALDGDADRLVAMDADGKPVWPDRLMMLFARDLLERQPEATIIHDVKCTRHLPRLIEELGGKPVMSPCGHSVIRTRMDELDSQLGGEFSGHIFFRERWFGFDDAIYAAGRLLELLAHAGQAPTATFDALPTAYVSPEYRVEMPPAEAGRLVETLAEHYRDDSQATLIRIDGLRVEYPDRWGVVRPSNTSAMLSMRFEGDTPEALDRIRGEIRGLLNAHSPELPLPF